MEIETALFGVRSLSCNLIFYIHFLNCVNIMETLAFGRLRKIGFGACGALRVKGSRMFPRTHGPAKLLGKIHSDPPQGCPEC